MILICYNLDYCGIRIAVNISVFQTEDTGSTPVSRTMSAPVAQMDRAEDF